MIPSFLCAAMALTAQIADLPENPFTGCVRVPEVSTRATCLYQDGDTLYCGASGVLYVLDVSNPLAPRLCGKVTGIGASRQIAAEKGMVYVGARETGVWIIDATKREAPRLVSRFDAIELATGMDVADGVLFVGLRSNGVEVADVRDPLHPAHIRIDKTPESQSVMYRDGWLYSGEWGEGGVTVIDAHDLVTLHTVGMPLLKGHGDGISLLGNCLYAATGHHYHDSSKSKEENFGKGHGLEIFDVSDPAHPQFVSRVQFPQLYVLGGDLWTPRPSADGKTVFVADTYNGLFAVDTMDVRQPRVIGRVTVPYAEGSLDIDGSTKGRPSTCCSYVAVGEGAVYFTAEQYGLGVLACPKAHRYVREKGRAPLHPEFRATYPTPESSRFTAWLPERRGQLRGAAGYGDFLYAACGQAGVAVLKEGTPGTLRQVGGLDVPFAGDVKVREGRLYVAEGCGGLAVYDLADPTRPHLVQRVTDFGGQLCCIIWVWTPHAPWVIVSGRGGYLYLDAHNPDKLTYSTQIASLSPGWDKYLSDDVVGGRWLAQSNTHRGFQWVDLGGKVPVVGEKTFAFNRGGVSDGCLAFKGDRILRLQRGKLVFLKPNQAGAADKSDWPGVKFPVNGQPAWAGGQPVWDKGTRLAVTSRVGKMISMFDISNETSPMLLWCETTVGTPDTSIFWRNRLVVPCGYQGLLLEK